MQKWNNIVQNIYVQNIHGCNEIYTFTFKFCWNFISIQHIVFFLVQHSWDYICMYTQGAQNINKSLISDNFLNTTIISTLDITYVMMKYQKYKRYLICGRYLLISLSITSWHFSNFPKLLLHRSPLAVIHWEVRTFNQTVDILLIHFLGYKRMKMMMKFLNLPFLANFSKLTGMSQTYHLMTNSNILYKYFCWTIM